MKVGDLMPHNQIVPRNHFPVVNPFGSMPRHAVSAAHVEAVLVYMLSRSPQLNALTRTFLEIQHQPFYRGCPVCKIQDYTGRSNEPSGLQTDATFLQSREGLSSVCPETPSIILTILIQYNNNQTTILIGETGSGKTTQYESTSSEWVLA